MTVNHPFQEDSLNRSRILGLHRLYQPHYQPLEATMVCYYSKVVAFQVTVEFANRPNNCQTFYHSFFTVHYLGLETKGQLEPLKIQENFCLVKWKTFGTFFDSANL